MKPRLTRLFAWATVLIGSLVAARISAGIKNAANHPNPEMWE